MNSLTKYFSCLSEKQTLLLLFALALIVRLIGVDYGYVYPDERINYSAKALAGQLVPDQHFYPPLLYYITAVFFAALYVLGRLINAWYNLSEFREFYFSNPTVFIITARLVTSLISASVAPLFYLIAKEVGLNKKYALVPAVLAIFIPVMVIHSHYSKVDVPLAVSVILVFYLAIKRLKVETSITQDVLLGIALSLCISFKHSGIFTIVPFSILLCAVFYNKYKDWSLLSKSLAISVVAALVSWPIFNIGIVLDFQNFLDYQKVQAVMSIRESDGFFESVGKWWSVVTHFSFGVNPVIVLLFLSFPFVIDKLMDLGEHKFIVYAIWLTIIISTFVVIVITGKRQIESLWLPQVTTMQLLAGILLGAFMQFIESRKKFVGIASFAFVLSLSAYGTSHVVSQALAKPVIEELKPFILSEQYQSKNTKILTNYPMPFPQSLEAKYDDLAREERLAKKYSIALNEKSDEFYREAEDSMYYRVMPLVYAGLEYSDDETLGEAMKPGLWPLQEEEWFLDYWLEQGIEVIMYSNFYAELETREILEMRHFLAEVQKRCELAKHIDAVKPLYVEYGVTVFDCRNAKQ